MMRTLAKMLTILMLAGFTLSLIPAEADASLRDRYEQWRSGGGDDDDGGSWGGDDDDDGGFVPRNDKPGNPVPEPSSALVFAAGLYVAHRVARRRNQA